MKKNKHIFLLTVCCLFTIISLAQKTSSIKTMKNLIDDDLKFAAGQYKVLIKNTPKDSMPRSFDPQKNKSIYSDIYWWCSGFYPATLWYIYEATHDDSIKKEAENRLSLLLPLQNYGGTHDLGFMMYCSFGNAYRLEKNPAYKTVILNSASALITRYRPSIKAIQSWNSNEHYKCPVIIDNMMNLELLEWASRNGGNKELGNIAVNHANTTIKNHFRPDYSSFHVVDYNLKTGLPIKKITAQGANDTSAWSRGQSWALYGYAMMYRFTKDTAYLSQAKHIAHFILTNPNLGSDKIPYWDFNAPNIPNALRDASAAAVLASALLELGQYVDKDESKQYIVVAETILRNLSSEKYLAKAGTNGGFLLTHSVGALPLNSEVDVPLTYADYYFIEALLRYKKWYL